VFDARRVACPGRPILIKSCGRQTPISGVSCILGMRGLPWTSWSDYSSHRCRSDECFAYRRSGSRLDLVGAARSICEIPGPFGPATRLTVPHDENPDVTLPGTSRQSSQRLAASRPACSVSYATCWFWQRFGLKFRKARIGDGVSGEFRTATLALIKTRYRRGLLAK
jgi:hypothetical protein